MRSGERQVEFADGRTFTVDLKELTAQRQRRTIGNRMFTGIIEHTAPVLRVSRRGSGAVIAVSNPWPTPPETGESVSVSGACLTVVSANRREILFDLSPETLEKTTFCNASHGRIVNLERALRAGDDISGHFVAGHVDALGRIVEMRRMSAFAELRVAAPAQIEAYLAPKGSVAVDGVSLTIADIEGEVFTAALIPATLERTTLDRLSPGDAVNIEVDIIARHVVRWLSLRGAAPAEGSITLDRLSDMGY